MKLKDWIAKQKLSTYEAAKLFKTTPQTVYNLLAGKEPRFSLVCRIVDKTAGEVGYTDLLPETLPRLLRKRLMALADTRQNSSDSDAEKKRNKQN
jgi:hypothetical protein